MAPRIRILLALQQSFWEEPQERAEGEWWVLRVQGELESQCSPAETM